MPTPAEVRRTTIALPRGLLEAADRAVDAGVAESRNDLLAEALRRFLAELRRAAIDAAFDGMAGDTDYLAEAELLEEGLDQASWETLQAAESI